MTASPYFRVQSPSVISETIDGETIIINLESGHYFSLNETGGEIWGDIQSGLNIAQVSSVCSLRYPKNIEAIPSAISEFFDSLLREGLIVPMEAPTSPQSLPEVAEKLGGNFENPALQKYEDMQDLLLLDPIHEVDEMGWPLTKSSA